MKKIWMSALDKAEEPVQKLMAQMKTYGLEIQGHFWEDNLEKMAWFGVGEALSQPDIALWAVLASAESLKSPSVRYGLSLAALALRAARSDVSIVILQDGADPIQPEELPTLLRQSDVLALSNPALGAKLVAKVHAPARATPMEYQLGFHGNPQLGQWFEIRPVEAAWEGIMFGVTGADIRFQAVGPKGGLPKTAELQYPMQGLKLTLGDTEYTAWAVRNTVDAETSYYVKVDGHPESVVFGPYGEDAAADVYIVTLK